MAEIAIKYQKKTDKQHVLDNPDTYTGSMEPTNIETYVFDTEHNKIIMKNIDNFIEGLYKIFDEAIVNARDHWIRQSIKVANKEDNQLPVTTIDITINEEGVITICNDGNGIDIVKHPEYGLWIPEMIFAHLRTSTNYDKSQKKIVGGKNGFGIKLVYIWSTEGSIETVDSITKGGLKYYQEFKSNLDIIESPKITKCTKKPYTKISFKPDYKRLGIENLNPDMLNLFKRRIYDIAAITDKSVKVKFNSQLLPVRQFSQYVDLYLGCKTEVKRCYEEHSERWEYVLALSPSDEFQQVSFVNGIFTSKGGKHVEYILNQIIRKLSSYILKKKKINVKPSTIKEQIMLFIRCDIENPSFDSQTKDYLTTQSSKFGSVCNVSDKFIEKIAKMGIMEAACLLTEVKDVKAAKKNDGVKSKNIRGIHKLVDANSAGTKESNLCTLLLVEGDSAKAGVVSGLSKEDRQYYGVYPLKGKLMNIRGASLKNISNNNEINDIKKIIGLETGKEYTQEIISSKLRYGKVLFLTDQDLDGTHIKGLCINMFDSEWESLINIPNFIGFMNTPILKAKKQSQEVMFYNDGEFENWKTAHNVDQWKVKYYKGLGTSTAKEFKEYFKNPKIVMFSSTGDDCRNSIDMVFNKKRSQCRKEWLENYNREDFMNTSLTNVNYKDFIKKEMIHFSKYDCDRSIPNIMDGLKTSQRKIIFAAFKRNLRTEIKVAQFSGYVSEHSCYHHGEASLNGAIVHMAQTYVGSNNINLLKPNGQFGTRLQGGNDSASERYIFTELNDITRNIFKKEDDNILNYLNDDGNFVEPDWYAPIIPMILINGSKGIGTGFSTDIPSFNPVQIITYMKNKILGKKNNISLLPYYEGFKGKIIPLNDNKFIIKGLYDIVSTNKVHITELPVGIWTDDYKEYLEKLIETEDKKKGNIIKEYVDLCTDKNVDITIIFQNNINIQELICKIDENGCNQLEKLLHLFVQINTNNMHVFDEKERLKKFNTPYEMINYYLDVRRNIYTKRKINLINELEKDTTKLSNKAKFIAEILNDVIDLRRKKNYEVISLLESRSYDKLDNNDQYDYLIKMPMNSVTEENIDKLNNLHYEKTQLLETLQNTTEEHMWITELDSLLEQYNQMYTKKQSKLKIKKKPNKPENVS
ncbi:toprim domain-containing protein [bacterium]|nr:toprim domain-containing protein [bacterium]